jgi:pyruvate formate lyase activating enzyme
MLVALRKTSLVDFPGKVAAVLFFRGCNLRCPWCQNRQLVVPGTPDDGLLSLEEALRHIEKRRAILGGVALSGGEPTLYTGLAALIARIKALGLAVKLDTNGMAPHVLKELFRQRETTPDYIALDLKVAPVRYVELGGKVSGTTAGIAAAPKVSDTAVDAAAPKVSDTTTEAAVHLQESAALIRASGILHEFRSLALPDGFFADSDIDALAPLVDDAPWFFRPFQPGNCLDTAWDELPATSEDTCAELAAYARLRKKRVVKLKLDPQNVAKKGVMG